MPQASLGTATAYFVRVLLALIGVWLCWSGITTVQIRKLDGVRVLPVWSRALVALAGGICILIAVIGRVR
jgi:hypothetical protein